METKEILQKARDLITDPDKWTQKAYAKDSKGMTVSLWSKEATCWCALGALYSFNEDGIFELPGDTHSRLQDHAGRDIVSFNDNSTHAEVLAAYDRAIESLEE